MNLKHKDTNIDLRYNVCYAPDEWASKAWEQLLQQNPTKTDFRYIIRWAPEKWKSKAQELLDKKSKKEKSKCVNS